MVSKPLPTQHLPAERATPEQIRQQGRILAEDPLLCRLLDGIPDIVVVINQHRQIIYFNSSLLRFLGLDDGQTIAGKRPGEVLDCVRAYQSDGGCGTTEFCQNCGAAHAIATALQGRPAVEECRVIRRPNDDALDLRVWTTPLQIEGQDVTLFAVADISDEKRRRALERIFFHDVTNTAAGVQGLAEMLREASPQEIAELTAKMHDVSRRLNEEINSQRELAAAEASELRVQPLPVSARGLVQEMARSYERRDITQGKRIEVIDPGADVVFVSDRTLIGRVIGNMLKNALEASQAGQVVTMGWKAQGAEVEFFVHNHAFMPRDTQLQIFQRSFTTKGPGRGLGTYSMRLLGERYLNGKVWFESTEGKGTTFHVCLRSLLPEAPEG